PFGAQKPNQPDMYNPGTPVSSAVGMSDIEAERCGERLASALILPARICGSATAPCTTSRSTVPDIRSVIAGPAPRYGMNCTFCLVRFSNSTPETLAAAFWLTKLILPGFAFIQL